MSKPKKRYFDPFLAIRFAKAYKELGYIGHYLDDETLKSVDEFCRTSGINRYSTNRKNRLMARIIAKRPRQIPNHYLEDPDHHINKVREIQGRSTPFIKAVPFKRDNVQVYVIVPLPE